MPIAIALDTSVFRSESIFSGVSFRLLRKLLQNGDAILYLSSVVVREFETAKGGELREKLRLAIKALRDVPPSSLLPEKQIGLLNLKTQLKNFVDSANTDFEEVFAAWQNESNCKLVPIAPDHAERVLNNYFAGHPPFKQIKNREDLPDGFVYEAIRDCAAQLGNLLFACHDNTLRSALAVVQGVTVFSSLKELLESPPIKQLLANVFIEDRFDAIRGYLLENEAELGQQLAELLSQELIDHDVHIRDDDSVDHRGWITHLDEFIAPSFSISEAQYLGENLIDLPFAVQIRATTSYHIFTPQNIDTSDDFILTDQETHYGLEGRLTLVLKFHDIATLTADFDPGEQISGLALEMDAFELHEIPDYLWED